MRQSQDDLYDISLCSSICHDPAMTVYRHVKLFKNGRSQAVRIPREFELPGKDAIMRRDGDKLIIEAAPPHSLLTLLAELSPIKDEFPKIDDPLPEPINF